MLHQNDTHTTIISVLSDKRFSVVVRSQFFFPLGLGNETIVVSSSPYCLASRISYAPVELDTILLRWRSQE